MPQAEITYTETLTYSAGKDKMSLSGRRAAREILLLCTTADIAPGVRERIAEILAGTVDWKYLIGLARFHNVAPLIYHNLATNGISRQIPQPYSTVLSRTYNNTLYMSVILADELMKILSTFNRNGIEAITLKGTTLAEQLYGNPCLRNVGDMDILVPADKFSLASSLIMNMGYNQSEGARAHPFHLVYCKREQFPFVIELHWNLDNQDLVTIPLETVWERARPIQLQDKTTMVLSPEDSLLFLANHFSKPSTQKLRSLCDIAELLKMYGNILDWDYIMASSLNWGIVPGVYHSLKLSGELLGAPAYADHIKAFKPGGWRRFLLDFLVSQEYFISTARLTKLKFETYTVFRSLTMKDRCRMALVLDNHRGAGKIISRLKTLFWIVLVFGAAAGRKIFSSCFFRTSAWRTACCTREPG